MHQTQFQVLTRESNTQARHGLFTVQKSKKDDNQQTTSKKLETPNCLLYTKAALPPNLTPDLFAEFKKLSNDGTLPAVQTSLQDLHADIASFEKYPNGIHDYCNYPHNTIIYVSIRDPSMFTDNTISNDSISLTSKSGKAKMTATDYVNIHKKLQADIIESVSMDVPGSTTTSKKSRKSTDTANAWIDHAIKNNLPNVFGVIQGGNLLKTRGFAARDVALRPVAGFVIGGLGLGEPAEERVEIIREVLKQLPDDKPRLVPGVGNPNEVLQCIELGIDLFNSNYPNIMTEWGHALTFSCSINNNNSEPQPFKLNQKKVKPQENQDEGMT